MFLTTSLSPSLSPSLSNNITPKVCCQKLRLFKGYLPNTSTPHNHLQVSSYSRNFIRTGFLYNSITPERTSHLLSVWGEGGGGVLGMVENFHSRFTTVVSPAPPPHPLFLSFPFSSFLFPFFKIFFCSCSSQNPMTNAL